MERREEALGIVMDTNVLVSAVLSTHGKCARILEYVIDGLIINFISVEILCELKCVLSRPKFAKVLSQEDINNYVQLIRQVSNIVIPLTRISVCKDPDDNKFLEVAYDSCAQIIVSGDPDLLSLRNAHTRETKIMNKRIKILGPTELLAYIHKKKP
ncbi:MAG: putative toxin-antitoxin system toxin component, PIN family [Candidatus Njordarchaeales archaeon]